MIKQVVSLILFSLAWCASFAQLQTRTLIVTDKDELNRRIDTLKISKQDNLYSGLNIKTINGVDLLGSGNIAISPGAAVDSLAAAKVVTDASHLFTTSAQQTFWNSSTFAAFNPRALGILYERAAWDTLTDDFDTTFSNSNFSLASNKIVTAGTNSLTDFSKALLLRNIVSEDDNTEFRIIFQASGVRSATSYGLSIGFRPFNKNYKKAFYAQVDLTSNSTVGKLSIVSFLGAALSINATNATAFAISQNDVCELVFKHNVFYYEARLTNLTTGAVKAVTFNSTEYNNAFNPAIINHGGSQTVIAARFTSFSNTNPDLLFLGDSKTAGFGAGGSYRYGDKVSKYLGLSAMVFAGSGDETLQIADCLGYLNRYNVKPKFAVIGAIGRNDIDHSPLSDYTGMYKQIDSTLQKMGCVVFHLLPMPELAASNVNQTPLQNFIKATYDTSRIIDVSIAAGFDTSVMMADNIHPNSLGYSFIADKIATRLKRAIGGYNDWVNINAWATLNNVTASGNTLTSAAAAANAVANYYLEAGQDGGVEYTVQLNNNKTGMLSLDATNVAQSAYTQLDEAVYVNSTVVIFRSGAQLSTYLDGQTSLVIRIMRVGGNIYYQVSRDGGKNFVNVRTVAATMGRLYLKGWFIESGSILKNVRGKNLTAY